MVFSLTFLFHFMYEWFPNPVFSIFFPVNESIWEHMKLLYSGFIFWSIIEYIILKKYKIKFHDFSKNIFLVSITSIIVYLILYLPLYHIFNENLFISILLLIIVIFLEEIFSYYLLLSKKNSLLNKVSKFLILLFYFVFIILTYNPPNNFLFYDAHNNCYEICKK